MLVDMTHANEQRPAATGNAADNVSDAPTGPATGAAARPTTVTADGATAQTPRPVQQPATRGGTSLGRGNTSGTVDDYRHGGGCPVAIVLGLGFFVNWDWRPFFSDHYDSGAISLAVLMKHLNPPAGAACSAYQSNTLLDPIRRPSSVAASKLLLYIGREFIHGAVKKYGAV